MIETMFYNDVIDIIDKAACKKLTELNSRINIDNGYISIPLK